MLDEKAWLTVSILRTLHRPVKFFHTKLTHPCLNGPCFVHSHVRTGRGHSQTVSIKLGECNCPKSLGMLKHSEFLSLE